MPHNAMNRRQLLQAGGVGGLALAVAALVPGSASASASASAEEKANRRAGGPQPQVTDLGPGVVQFSLMSGLLVGDTAYIGSRNLNPPRVIGFHVPSHKVVSRTDLGSGYSIQALAADPTGRYLYAGLLRNVADSTANLYRWDLSMPNRPAVALGTTGDRDVRALTVAPDGKVYLVGGGETTAPPSLWQYDPATGAITSWGVIDPGATIAQAVAATASTVYVGSGSVLAGGGGASPAKLWAFDRSTKTATNILPQELSAGVSVTSLSVLGDLLAVGAKGPGKSALLSIADHTKYSIIAKTGTQFRRNGDDIYFVKDPYVWGYNLKTRKISQTQTDGLGTIWGLDVYGSELVGVSADGLVAEINPAAHTTTSTDLVGAGAPAGPQLGMGISAGAGSVYVGGTSTIARHQLCEGTVTNIRIDGEAKDSVVVNGVLYTGQYNSQGIWTYDPNSGKPPYQAAALPAGQNRPLAVCWDEVNQLVLAGAQDDTGGGGSFTAYSPATGKATSWVNPIDSLQMVRAVATRDGVAYLGGDNIYATGPRSTIVAWDPVAGKELWRLDPGLSAGIAALATHGHYLYGMSRQAAGLFVLDLRTRRIVHTIDASAVCTDFGAMVVSRGVVYGVSDTTVFRIDPGTFAVSVVVAAVNGGWYSGPHIAADENGLLYTLRGANLVQIDDHRAPASRHGRRRD